jgi:hypothetical protein
MPCLSIENPQAGELILMRSSVFSETKFNRCKQRARIEQKSVGPVGKSGLVSGFEIRDEFF